jgi:predicted nucleotide-binding protein
LTGDDLGKGVKEKKHRPRPRQNVIFEFGFFIGKLGRTRVCGLKEGDVEVPSDYDGVLYIRLDEEDHWRTLLARELRSAGYHLRTNKLLE